MRFFTSTRGSASVGLADAVFRGLAPDGGLYVPSEIGTFPADVPRGAAADFGAVARWTCATLFPELSEGAVARAADEAFSFPVPLVEVEAGTHVLELIHGPTHAFKDFGARFLARLMAMLDTGGERRTVLVATSGDTGGAVADAFHGLDAFQVVVLFPRDGISARQRRQMTTLGGNVTALAVEGSFDDCQRLAKAAFLDAELSARHGLTSANSINIGRLLPQCVYYVYAAAHLGWAPDAYRFAVPSGNLGNLCAGLMAQRMGMPAAGFVAATNANRGFANFLAGDDFQPGPTIATVSSAMDVGAPSNLERLLWLYDHDAEALRADVVGVAVSDEDTRRCMREVFERTGYVLDPHSAVAFEARHRSGKDSTEPWVVLSTAHPAKFPDVVEEAVGHVIPLPPGIERTTNAKEYMIDIPPTADALRGVLDHIAQ